MRINFNTNYDRQTNTSFQGFHFPYEVESIVLSRAAGKKQKATVEEIRTLMTEFDNKQVMIDLMTDPTGEHLEASVYDGQSYYEHFKEGWFSETFRSPLGFIRRLVKKARRVEEINKAKAEVENSIKTAPRHHFESYKI
jgi:hypothetical protein